MTENCNSDILAQARANVGERTTPANARAIATTRWVHDGTPGDVVAVRKVEEV